MIIVWLLYYFLSFLIAFLLTIFFEKRLLKTLIFSLVISLLGTIWFISPGSSQLAPIASIFFLETTIIEYKGYLRIFRPFVILFLLTFTLSLIFWKKRN
tara:strand:+ start:1838 stop:2134 length:297 start_codon:yes stop_codon:yes gene_type:complete